MLKFLDIGDFKKVDAFKENENGDICWTLVDGDTTHKGVIPKGCTKEDSEGGVVPVWENLVALDLKGEIEVGRLGDAEKAEIEASKQRAIENQKKTAAKFEGVEIKGVRVSLTEENQNGMAAVMQGVNLAAEMGADIFPLNFNAQTPAGFKLMTFEAAADFKTFCLTFMAERQKFFK